MQTDAYDGDNAVVAVNGLTHLWCMPHARRKFSEAVKAPARNKKRGKAHSGLALIHELYWVEKHYRKLTTEERYARRQKQAFPILDEMRTWLDDALPQVPSTSATGKALDYLHNEWSKLICYMDDCRLESYAYLRYLFQELPRAATVEDIEALFPSNLDKGKISIG